LAIGTSVRDGVFVAQRREAISTSRQSGRIEQIRPGVCLGEDRVYLRTTEDAAGEGHDTAFAEAHICNIFYCVPSVQKLLSSRPSTR
jgi:hypothetical protein